MKKLFQYGPGLLLLTLLAACAGEYPGSSISPSTDFAETIHGIYVQIFWWSMLILAVVWVVLAYILVKFRERPDSPEPKQIHGHLGMEIAWTIGPALIVVAIAIPTIQAVFATQTPPEDPLVVDVVGHQYWWEFRYPQNGDVVTANELHLPAGEPIALRIWSEDVIHSFWVPQLGGKKDANPVRVVPAGEETRYNWIYFTANEEGDFWGQCAEFCGPSHSRMGMNVVVESREEFEAWLDDLRTGHPLEVYTSEALTAQPVEGAAAGSTPAQETPGAQDAAPSEEERRIAEGRNYFMANCAACHAINGFSEAGVVAPNLTLLGRRSKIAAGLLDNTLENLIDWISDPQSIKPGALMPGLEYSGGREGELVWPAFNLTDDQVVSVATYLHSLR